MVRSLGVLTCMLSLAAGCGSTPAASTSSASASTSGSERPVARRIEPTARTSDAPHPISREAFDAQWAETRPTEPALDMSDIRVFGAPSGPYAVYGGLGVDAENPIGTCGADESYAVVASYVCPDGSMPLGGDGEAGARARVGNVGANSTGHIIDLYVVPCVTGPIELYVDLYACPDSGYPY